MSCVSLSICSFALLVFSFSFTVRFPGAQSSVRCNPLPCKLHHTHPSKYYHILALNEMRLRWVSAAGYSSLSGFLALWNELRLEMSPLAADKIVAQFTQASHGSSVVPNFQISLSVVSLTYFSGLSTNSGIGGLVDMKLISGTIAVREKGRVGKEGKVRKSNRHTFSSYQATFQSYHASPNRQYFVLSLTY